jgi:hypothetical protein
VDLNICRGKALVERPNEPWIQRIVPSPISDIVDARKKLAVNGNARRLCSDVVQTANGRGRLDPIGIDFHDMNSASNPRYRGFQIQAASRLGTMDCTFVVMKRIAAYPAQVALFLEQHAWIVHLFSINGAAVMKAAHR